MSLNAYARQSHADNLQWWRDLETGARLERDKIELLALAAGEIIGEALEGHRKNLMDDHLPHRRMVEVELADGAIRLFDYAGAFALDLDAAYRVLRSEAGYKAATQPGDLDAYGRQVRELQLVDFGNAPLHDERKQSNRAARLMRINAEICVAAQYAGFEASPTTEAAGVVSALVAIFDYAAEFGCELEAAYQEKRAYNLTRADHKREARLAAHGKKF